MNSIDLSEIRRLYRDGTNIIEHLKNMLGVSYNTEQLVEISYDMQAGSYIEYVRTHRLEESIYQEKVAEILRQVMSAGDSVVDVGTGEMTTLGPVASLCYEKVSTALAIDISVSRLVVGREYLRDTVPEDIASKIKLAAATLFHLPLACNSVDIIWTSHGLEPNGGREQQAISELARVARKYVVLFEPSYERNTVEGRARMDRLGYVRNIVGSIEACPDLELLAVEKMTRAGDDPNPTYAHVVRKQNVVGSADFALCCPLTQGVLEQRGTCMFSRSALLAYPIIEQIPVLRIEKGISASVLDCTDGIRG